VSRSPTLKTLAVLFAALFLFAQGMASAHIAEFGTTHDHDGMACSVSVLGENQAVIPAPIETPTVPVVETLPVTLSPTKIAAFTATHPARAPPPRAPPH
jgi:hypothetical protein